MFVNKSRRCLLPVLFCLIASWACAADHESILPEFGRDTVLVWEADSGGPTQVLVVRLAAFYPDLLMEWEDIQSQGTVLITNKDILQAKGFTHKRLFKAGSDSRSDKNTTMWLSRRIFRELKDEKEAKFDVDHIPTRMTYNGDDTFIVEMNGSEVSLPAIVVLDDRGGERWILDREENPLMLKYTLRQYTQSLVSITTDRKDTLRWLRGAKIRKLLP